MGELPCPPACWIFGNSGCGRSTGFSLLDLMRLLTVEGDQLGFLLLRPLFSHATIPPGAILHISPLRRLASLSFQAPRCFPRTSGL